MKMLELLDRFERLQLGCLRQNIRAKYEATLQQFMAEIEQLRLVGLCMYMCKPHSQSASCMGHSLTACV